MNNNYIVDIQNSLNEPQVSELGGKGASLVKLTKGKFPVPEGFILTTTSYDLFAKQLHLCDKYSSIQTATTLTLPEAEKVSDEIKELFMNSEFPMDYIEDLKKSIEIIKQHDFKGPNLLAVRSSATTEDLGDASFAGMQDTILNVPIELEAIKKAILQCWASLYTPRAILYRFEKHFPVIDTSIAVVVQRMIPSDKSGVIFSCDPQTSSREHISLDGVQGLGEALVSGLVSTDHWSIRKHYPIDKEHTELRIVERIINEQEFAFYTLPEGGTEKVYLKEKGKLSCFTDEEIYKISQYAVEIEEYYHKPMDIEFCIYNDTIYIVQARPITTLFELPEEYNPLSSKFSNDFKLLISFNHMQMMLKPFTECGYSFMTRISPGFGQCFKHINGFVYIDYTPFLSYSFLQNYLLNILRTDICKEIAQIADEWIQTDLPYAPPLPSIWGLVWSKLSYFKYTYLSIPWSYFFSRSLESIYQTFVSETKSIMQETDQLYEESLKENSSLTLEGLLQDLIPMFLNIKRISFYIMLSKNYQKKIEDIFKQNCIQVDNIEKFYGGSKENLASQMNYEIYLLYNSIMKTRLEDNNELYNQLYKYMKNEDEQNILLLVQSCETSIYESYKEFYALWMNFMKIFGRRGINEIDMGVERYYEKPSMLLGTILNTDYSGIQNVSPEERENEANRIVEEYCSKLTNENSILIHSYLPLARYMFAYREHPKYFLITFSGAIHHVIKRIGVEYYNKHELNSINDIFQCSFEELMKLNKGEISMQQLIPSIEQRKQIYLKYSNTMPPKCIISQYSAVLSISNQTKQELLTLPPNILKGMPTSAGIIEGKVVVVTDPREGHLQKGDILVAPATDPAWTPLFVPAAGVVIEIGGPLTHGSIVAREMGISCVVNIPHLLEKVKTGMKIRIDGSQGTIELL